MDRYYSVIINTERQYLACMRYIDRNAYVAGLAKSPVDWKWSSAAHYVLGIEDDLITDADCYQNLSPSQSIRQKEYQTLINTRLPFDSLPNELKKHLKGYFSNTYKYTF